MEDSEHNVFRVALGARGATYGAELAGRVEGDSRAEAVVSEPLPPRLPLHPATLPPFFLCIFSFPSSVPHRLQI
jgi:hypothetical protein